MVGPPQATSTTTIPSGPSIRSQIKKQKTGGAGPPGNSKNNAGVDREVVKAAIANPLTVPWPNIPRHLQNTLLHALPQLVPSEIADHHVSRARCHQNDKRERRKERRKDEEVSKVADATTAAKGSEKAAEIEEMEAEVSVSTEVVVDKQPGKRPASNTAPSDSRQAKKARIDPENSNSKHEHPPRELPKDRPHRPPILDHLVLGINEVIKGIEKQTDELKLRMMMMADALNGTLKKKVTGLTGAKQNGEQKGGAGRELLPTAPLDVDLTNTQPSGQAIDTTTQTMQPQAGEDIPSKSVATAIASEPKMTPAPITWIFIPLSSISPQTLVSPVPQYSATYNTLVYQHIHLSKICKTRLPSSIADDLVGEQLEELRVVPMGKVEGEMAEMVGLRRLACLGVRNSHPAIKVPRDLLPKSVLHPPRHSLTLPFPITSNLRVINDLSADGSKIVGDAPDEMKGEKSMKANTKKQTAGPVAAVPSALIHYAPLHVKGITTTIPADGNARKAKRMEEVRQKRRDKKEKRRFERTGKSSKKVNPEASSTVAEA